MEQYGQPSLAKIREIMADFRKETIGKAEWLELEKLLTAYTIREYLEVMNGIAKHIKDLRKTYGGISF